MRTVLFISILSLTFAAQSHAQDKRDTMEISAMVVVNGNSLSIEAHVRPWGNPGITYFELNGGQYGLRSWSGQENMTIRAFNIDIKALEPSTSYAIKMIAANDKGQILNTKEYKFKTRPKPKAAAANSKKKRK